MRQKQHGFTVAELLLLLVFIALIVFLAWRFFSFSSWSSNSNQAQEIDSITEMNKSDRNSGNSEIEQDDNLVSFLDGDISFDLGNTWKVADGGYKDLETRGACPILKEGDDCLEEFMIIPVEDTFTNPDQFNVSVLLFGSDNKDFYSQLESLSSENEWVVEQYGEDEKTEISSNILDGQEVTTIIQNRFGDTRRYFSFIEVEDKYVIYINSTFFSGENNSSSSDKSYFEYEPLVEDFVKSFSYK